MDKRNKILLGILAAILWVVGGYLYSTWDRKQLLQKPKMYPYVYYEGSAKQASVIIMRDLKYKEEYVDYYKKLFQGKTDMVFNEMPIRGLPTLQPVYVIEYSEDSLLAKVISLAPTPRFLGNGYLEGWVYTRSLHTEPPK